MPTPYRQQQINLLKAAKKESDDLFDQFVTFLQGLLVRYADKSGQIPNSALRSVQKQVANEYSKLMLGGPTKNGSLVPFDTQDGKVIPRSAYAKLLWKYLEQVTRLGVSNQVSMLRKSIPDDILQELKNKIPPNAATLNAFFKTYRGPLQWIDPSKRRLNDRLWNATGDGIKKINHFLEQEITHRDIQTSTDDNENTSTTFTGNNVADIAKGIATIAFFYEAQRLLLNELYTQLVKSDAFSATLNPIISGYAPHTSPSHEVTDECDDEEAGGPYNIDDDTHYPPFHPVCMCEIQWLTFDTPLRKFEATNNGLWLLLLGNSILINALLNGPQHE